MKGEQFDQFLKANYEAEFLEPIEIESIWSEIDSQRKRKRRVLPVWWVCAGMLVLFLAVVSYFVVSVDDLDHVVSDKELVQYAMTVDSEETNGIMVDEASDYMESSTHHVSEVIHLDSTQDELTSTDSQSVLDKLSLSTSFRDYPSAVADDQVMNRISDAISYKTGHLQTVNHSIESSRMRTEKRTFSSTPYILPTLGDQAINKSIDPIAIDIALSSRIFHRQKWYTEFGISYGIAHNNLDAIDALNQADVDFRKQKERHLDYWEGRILVGRNISDRFALAIGLSFNQQVSRYRDQIISQEKIISEDVLVQLIQRSDGSTEEVFATAEIDSVHIRDIVSFQKFRSLSIPFRLNYDVELNENIDFGLTTGLNIGIRQFNTGLVRMNESADPIDIESAGYDKPIIQSAFGLYIAKRIQDDFSIKIGVQTNFDLASRFTGSNYSDVFLQSGFNVAIRRLF